MSNPTSPQPIIAPPQVYRWVGDDALIEAYDTVQCSDTIKDGDVVVALCAATGLSVGFVYKTAWVATVHTDHPEGGWEAVDDLDALAADLPEYAPSLHLAHSIADQVKADQDRQRAQSALVVDQSAANRQHASATRFMAREASLAAIPRDATLRDSFVQARRAYHEQLRMATAAVIADYQYENSHLDIPDLQALLEARCWFHQPPMELRADLLVSAYALVSEADEQDLKAIGWDLSAL